MRVPQVMPIVAELASAAASSYRLVFNTILTIVAAFPPRFTAFPDKRRSDPPAVQIPLAHASAVKRQRLPPSLLVDNASVRDPSPPPNSLTEAFPIKPSDKPGLTRLIGKRGS
jgi:hypothetical protein